MVSVFCLRGYRIQTDRETGNSKGFAFAEYDDAETAQHAVLNLNNAEIHGRPIKVHSRTLPSSAPRQKSPSLPIPTTTTSPIVRTTAAIKYKPPTTTKAKTRTKIGSALHARPFDLAATINLLSIEELYGTHNHCFFKSLTNAPPPYCTIEFVVETHALISTDPHAANLLFGIKNTNAFNSHFLIVFCFFLVQKTVPVWLIASTYHTNASK